MSDSEQWFKEHAAYLQTAEWRARRQAVLRRDHWHCQAAFEICTGRAEEAHHLTYRHWRNEPLFDLVAVCNSCHDLLTSIDRRQRLHTTEPDERVLAQTAAARLMQLAQQRANTPAGEIPA